MIDANWPAFTYSRDVGMYTSLYNYAYQMAVAGCFPQMVEAYLEHDDQVFCFLCDMSKEEIHQTVWDAYRDALNPHAKRGVSSLQRGQEIGRGKRRKTTKKESTTHEE